MSLKSSNKIDTNRYELVISIDADTFKAAIDDAYKKNIKKMNVPGFRKGKAPKGIVEKMYGENVFFEDALEALYPAAIDEAAEAANVVIVDFQDVKFDLVSMDKETGIEFKVEVTVKPEVKIGAYKGLKAEKASVEATDEDVNAEIEQMRVRGSRLVEVTDRAAQNDDIVVIDFEGFVDGVAFEGGKGDSYSLTLGSGQFIPGFEDQIVGHKAGDEFDVNVKFPEDYQAEELKGKDSVFKCKLHEIKVRELPEVDDEFVKDMSDFDTVAELKEDIKKKITERKEKGAADDVEHQLINALLEGFEAEIPEAMIETRIDDNLRDFDYNLQMQGLNLQQYLQYMGGDVKALRDSFRENAERQVKVRLALEKVVELEGIKASQEEIDAEFARYADAYKMPVEKIKEAIPEKEVASDMAVKAATELIKAEAKVTEVVAAKAEKKAPAKKTTTTAKKTTTASKTTASKSTAAKKTTTTAKKTTATKSTTAKKTATKKTEKED